MSNIDKAIGVFDSGLGWNQCVKGAAISYAAGELSLLW